MNLRFAFALSMFMGCAHPMQASKPCAEVQPVVTSSSNPSTLPVVYLNHLYAVIDPETLMALESDSFLSNHFAQITKRTVTSDNESWIGVYLMGRRTYVEFFGPGAKRSTAQLGIGLGVEETGGIARLVSSVLEKTGTYHLRQRVRETDSGERIPWFINAEVASEKDKDHEVLAFWAMEYLPEFMRKVHGTANLDRQSYLRSRYRPERLFEDVTSVTMEVPSAEFDLTAKQFLAYGWQLTQTQGAFEARGPESVTFSFRQAKQARLTALELTLTRDVASAETHHIGRLSTLSLGPGRRARWVFGAR